MISHRCGEGVVLTLTRALCLNHIRAHQLSNPNTATLKGQNNQSQQVEAGTAVLIQKNQNRTEKNILAIETKCKFSLKKINQILTQFFSRQLKLIQH